MWVGAWRACDLNAEQLAVVLILPGSGTKARVSGPESPSLPTPYLHPLHEPPQVWLVRPCGVSTVDSEPWLCEGEGGQGGDTIRRAHAHVYACVRASTYTHTYMHSALHTHASTASLPSPPRQHSRHAPLLPPDRAFTAPHLSPAPRLYCVQVRAHASEHFLCIRVLGLGAVSKEEVDLCV
jgi:hypothetical protein